MLTVVTSCSRRIYHECGRDFIASFAKFWPADVRLFVVSEDDLPPLVHGMYLPLMDKAIEFLRRNDNERAKGRLRMGGDAGWTPKKVAEGYNFRYDAYRFAKKVFAITQAAGLCEGGKLYWIDADVVTFAQPPADLLNELLPPGAALCCLDRGTYHSECGFVGYNLEHPLGRAFINEFADLYASGQVFGLHEWHDSWVFDWLRRKLAVPTYPIAHTSRHHPFVNSVLGTFMDHKKGARKAKGRTPAHEITSAETRSMPYWQGAA